MLNNSVKKILAPVIFLLPHTLPILYLPINPFALRLYCDIFTLSFYNSIFDFIIPWGFLCSILFLHFFFVMLTIKKQSLSIALIGAGIMGIGYYISLFLFVVASFSDGWGTM